MEGRKRKRPRAYSGGVTLAPPASDHKAWMPRSCSSSDMAGTSTPNKPAARGGPERISGHESCLGAQGHHERQAFMIS